MVGYIRAVVHADFENKLKKQTETVKFTCFSACLNACDLCLSFNMANLCRLHVTCAPQVHKGRSTAVTILKYQIAKN